MKKAISVLLVCMVVFSLAACGSREDGSEKKEQIQTGQQEQAENSSKQQEQKDITASDPVSAESDADEQMQGDDSGAGGLLENVTRDNGADIAKELFGIDVVPGDGWECTSADSYNKVNNFSITYEGSLDADGKALMQFYYDATAAVFIAGICGQVTDWETGKVSETDPYADFETFFTEDKNTSFSDGYASALWIYEYSGKSIQFSFLLQGSQLSLMMTLMS